MARRPFYKPVHAKEERNGPPSATQGLSTAKPRSSFLQLSPEVATFSGLSVETHPPPPVPPFLLVQNLSPKDIARSDITS